MLILIILQWMCPYTLLRYKYFKYKKFNYWASKFIYWASRFIYWASKFIYWTSKFIYWTSKFNHWTSKFIYWTSSIERCLISLKLSNMLLLLDIFQILKYMLKNLKEPHLLGMVNTKSQSWRKLESYCIGKTSKSSTEQNGVRIQLCVHDRRMATSILLVIS